MNDPAYPGDADTYAPLTSKLLARKGQAQPTFDTDAYAEVMSGNEFSAPLSPIFTRKEPSPPHVTPSSATPSSATPSSRPPTPHSAPPRKPPAPQAKPARPFSASPVDKRRAAVTFQLARDEYKRLRRAATELDMSCHRIILDAIECYLDANEVAPVRNQQWVDVIENAAEAVNGTEID